MFNFLLSTLKYSRNFLLTLSILVISINCLVSPIVVFAQESKTEGLAFLQPSGIKCLFYAEKDGKPLLPECTKDKALTEILVEFLRQLAPAVTTLLIIFGGYEYFVDKEAKKTSALSTIIAAISGFIIITLAPVITGVIKKTFNNSAQPFDSTAIKELLEKLIFILIDLSSVVSVAVIVLGGYAYFIQFFVNGGKQEGKLNARDLLFGGVMGLTVTILASPIVKFIKKILEPTKDGVLAIDQGSIVNLIKIILGNFLIPFASIASLVFIVASAYMWITAGSDEDRVKNAKKMLNNSLIGLVIVLLSTVIVQLIVYFVQPGISFIPGSSS